MLPAPVTVRSPRTQTQRVGLVAHMLENAAGPAAVEVIEHKFIGAGVSVDATQLANRSRTALYCAVTGIRCQGWKMVLS